MGGGLAILHQRASSPCRRLTVHGRFRQASRGTRSPFIVLSPLSRRHGQLSSVPCRRSSIVCWFVRWLDELRACAVVSACVRRVGWDCADLPIQLLLQAPVLFVRPRCAVHPVESHSSEPPPPSLCRDESP